MIAADCPTPTQGPVPCPSTVEQHLTNIRKILPRGIAWISVFDPLSVMYGYFRGVATTYQWANDQYCQAIKEFFCSTREVLAPDYLVEFGLPDPCNPNLDPCLMLPRESARCSDLVDFVAAAGWSIQCAPNHQSASLCAVCGCDSVGFTVPGDIAIVVDTGDSPIYTPGISAASGIAASGISVMGCINQGPGTLSALECLVDEFLPAHFQFELRLHS